MVQPTAHPDSICRNAKVVPPVPYVPTGQVKGQPVKSPSSMRILVRAAPGAVPGTQVPQSMSTCVEMRMPVVASPASKVRFRKYSLLPN